MRGRDFFKLFKWIIFLLAALLGFLPRFFRIGLYELCSTLPTRFGIFIRYIVLKSLLPSMGDNVYVARHVVIKNYDKLRIGNNTSIHEFCYLDAFGEISIGDHVSIAHRSSIISFDHGYDDGHLPIKYNPLCAGKINISNDVWIGAGVTILKDVCINERVIVAAGAVVKNDLVSNHIYGGVPARKLKEI